MKLRTPVKFKNKRGETVRGVVASKPVEKRNGAWVSVKDNSGAVHSVRPSQLTAI